MKFQIQDHIQREKDIEWDSEKPFQGLRNKDNLPMTMHESGIFNDMLKFKAFTHIEPMKTYLIKH